VSPEPKLSVAPPYRWQPCVVLRPADIDTLLAAIPTGAPMADSLRETAQAAEEIAARLNLIDRGEAA
jgi:hypothetical protein